MDNNKLNFYPDESYYVSAIYLDGGLDKAKEFIKRFTDEHKATCCRVLTRGLDMASLERKSHCTNMVDFCEKLVKDLCNSSNSGKTYVTCSPNYSYYKTNSTTSSSSCSTTSAINCNSANVGKSYISSCNPTSYSYNFGSPISYISPLEATKALISLKSLVVSVL